MERSTWQEMATLEEVGLRVLRKANAIKERGASSFWHSIMCI